MLSTLSKVRLQHHCQGRRLNSWIFHAISCARNFDDFSFSFFLSPSCFSFQVDLRFPQSGAADPNLVTVTGRPELVDEAIDHLLNLEEEYVSSPKHFVLSMD